MKLDNVFELSYVVNLDERKDRLDKLEESWYRLNFYPERFSAIRHGSGAIGCYLSHLAILKEAREKNKSVLVFEDDIEIFDQERVIVENSLSELLDQEDWWLWYGSGNILRPFYQVTPCLARLNHCQSTVFYGANKKHLEEIIEIIERQVTYIDVIYSELIVRNHPCFITVPMIGIQRPDYSDIEKQVVDYRYTLDRYNQHFVSMYKK